MLNYNFQPGSEGPHCSLSFSPSVTDWQAVEGWRRPTSFLPLAFLHSRLLYCTACHLDHAVMSCRSLFLSVWRKSSNFSCIVREFYIGKRPAWPSTSRERERERERGGERHCWVAYPTNMQYLHQNPLLGDWYWSVVHLPLLSPFDQLFLTRAAFQHTDAGRDVCDTDVSWINNMDWLWTSSTGNPGLLNPQSHLFPSPLRLAGWLVPLPPFFFYQQHHNFFKLDGDRMGKGKVGRRVGGEITCGGRNWGRGLIYDSDFSSVIPWLSLGSWVGGWWGPGVAEQLNNVYMPTTSGWYKATKMLPS